jgi:membrane protease subunit (stomatin/prohibitin family)
MDTLDTNQSAATQTPTPKPRQALNLLRWVSLVDRLEAGARYLFLGMAMMSFVAYGYMVYTQDQWQTNHRQLQKLRNQESQQAIINARLRNQAAELAEKDNSGTIDPSPGRAVFVPITDAVASTNKSASRKLAPTSPEISITVGY